MEKHLHVTYIIPIFDLDSMDICVRNQSTWQINVYTYAPLQLPSVPAYLPFSCGKNPFTDTLGNTYCVLTMYAWLAGGQGAKCMGIRRCILQPREMN